jgi:phosphoglucosamine mutase
MEDEVTQLCEDYLDGKLEVFGNHYSELPFATRENVGRTIDYVAGRNRYIGYLISNGIYSFNDIKIGLDCANGASWAIAKSVFDALGAQTYVINNAPDGTNINRDAGSTHIEHLQKFVVDNKLDIGFAYDGDADRCLAVDELGNVLTGDHILYFCGKYLKEQGKLRKNTVVATIMSNMGLFKALDECGIEYAKTDVGDKNVYDYMKQNGCSLGGEESGHIIFSNFSTTGDGILTSLKIMEAMITEKKKASELSEGFKVYPQKLINVRVTDQYAAISNAEVLKKKEQAEKELGDNGRILLRKSGTEPVIRVMVEAQTIELCEKYTHLVADEIVKQGYSE